MKAVSGFLALVLLASSAVGAPAGQSNYDIQILQFALNLEYLEANFYSCAAFGYPLAQSLIGATGVVATGCNGKAALSAAVLALATEIANDELSHVAFLRSALGANAVPQPAINIGSAFVNATTLAFGKVLSPAFSAYGTDALFLLSAFIFEDVGVTAYKGAAPLITNTAYLGPAAGIMAVEAYHAGAVRRLLLTMTNEYVYPYGVTVGQAAAAIAALRASVDGIGMDDYGLKNATATANIIAPVDSNAMAFGRLPVNVLPIVYLGGTSSGGFFPSGLNGYFTSTVMPPSPPPALSAPPPI